MPERLPALIDPPLTAAKRLGAFMGKIDWQNLPKGKREAVTIPGLDVAALQRQYGPERAHLPQIHRATFQVPLDATRDAYEGIRKNALEKFFTSIARQGWDLAADNQHLIRVYPGVYPAHELGTGVAILDRREFIAEAHFCFRNPQPLRIELDPRLTQPLVIRR